MKAGILIESLGMSQKAYEIIREINKLEKLDEYWDMTVFYLEFDRLITPPEFGLMNMVEAYGFNAPVISTSIETTKISLKSIRPTKRFFYVFDMEWTSNTYDVDYLLDVYMNPEVELIARSDDHAKVIEQSWKAPIDVIENFNYEKLTKLISK
jgi:hypothetical protein